MQTSILTILSINPSIYISIYHIQHFSYPRYDRTDSTWHRSEVVQPVDGVARLVEALADRIAGHQEHGALHLDEWMEMEVRSRVPIGIGVPTSSRRPSNTSVFTISSVSSADSSIYAIDESQSIAEQMNADWR